MTLKHKHPSNQPHHRPSMAAHGIGLMAAWLIGVGLIWPLPSTDPAPQPQPAVSPPQAQRVEATVPARSPQAQVNQQQPGDPQGVEPDANLRRLADTLPAPHQGSKGYVEYPYTTLGATNDTLAGSQWHLGTTMATTAWDRWTGSSTVTIAIIDTGFALGHEDLSAKWKLNDAEMGATASQGPAPNCTSRGLALDKRCNNLDDDDNGYTDDWRGWDFVADDNDPQTGTANPYGDGVSHGSFVAGLAGAASNNGRGVAGIDRGAQLLPLQALDDNGDGFTSSVAEAVRYAADQGADVINMSLGSAYSDSYLRAQIAYAQSLGVVVVAAAGNEGCANCLSYPANFSEVLAVGASTSTDARASFSSWGVNLDMVAPGVGLCSVAWATTVQTTGYSCGGQGTSFAAPLVSGTAGLIAGRQPGITVTEVTNALIEGADTVSSMNGAISDPLFGYGRLNVYRSLQQLALPVAVGGLGGNKDGQVELSLAENRDVVTLCRGTVGNCRLRFTGPDAGVVLSPANPLNHWGDVVIQWHPNDFGLTAGEWQMEPAWPDGTASGYPPVTVTVTP